MEIISLFFRISVYTKMLKESRELSLDSLFDTDIFCMRSTTFTEMTGMIEFSTYGTMVKIIYLS